MGSHFEVGETTTHFTLFWCTTHRDFSGDWDVHWVYGVLTHGHLRDRASTTQSRINVAFALECFRLPGGQLQLNSWLTLEGEQKIQF